MKKLAGFIFILFLFCGFSAHSQQKIAAFIADSVKFPKDLGEYLQTGLATKKEVSEFMDKFNAAWKSPAYTHYYKTVTYDMCNDMLTRRIPVYPMFQSFLNCMLNFVQSKLTPDQFNQWIKCVKKLIAAKPQTNFGNYLSMSEKLFASNTFFKSPTLSWASGSNTYTFNCDSMPIIIFKNIDLKCYNERNDSVVIKNTSGIFYPLKGIWTGHDGKVDWTRTGLDASSVWGELKNYNIVCKQEGFVADSVTFYNKAYFDKPLLGRVIEKNVSEPKGKETYPRFVSYGKRFAIPNLTPDVTYNGGFSMKGRRFVGAGSQDQPAELIFKRDNKDFLVASALEYSITKDQIMTDDARIVIHLDTDSIYHPDIQMVYNIPKKHLSLIRTTQGLSQSPYFDTYHKVNMYFEELSWNTDNPKMVLHNLPGSASNVADFESQNFFRPGLYDAFSSQDGANIITMISKFCKAVQSRDFTLTQLATYLHYESNDIRLMVLKMASIGLLLYDVQTENIHVQDKMFTYIQNKIGKADYDVIDFHSENPGQDNGDLDLLTNDMTLHGIKGVILSDSQNVYIYPQKQEVVLHRNRNITFAGNVHAGRFDFYGQHFAFNYNDFKIKMQNTDSVRIKAESFEKDAQGRRHLVPVKSVIEHLTGELAIDQTDNKSGLKGLKQYPILRSDTNSFVYYDKKSIQNGVYKRDKFYFEVDPFNIDSLGTFTNAGLHFSGTFASAGIVPEMREVLRLQPDYSLGFVHDGGTEGLALYGGKAKFENKLKLSNKGLKGDGTIDYVTSVSKSNDITFFPDSAHAIVNSFVVNEQKTPPEFPSVTGDTVQMRWWPKQDFMGVADIKKPFACYHSTSTFHGSMGLTPKILTGNGLVDFKKASLKAKLIKFKQHKFLSDTADFDLKAVDTAGIAFNTHNMNSEVDFEKKMGEFKSNGSGSYVEFQVNKYIAYMDEFKWYMEQDLLELSASKKQVENSAEAKEIQLSGSRFISVAKGQDSLQFIAPSARFNLRNYLITARNVPYINVADARIIPDSGKVLVHRNAFMEPLIRAKIIANTVTKYYKLYNADVNVTSRKNYTGSAYYDYVDELKTKRPIFFSNIRVDTTHQTIANTTISDSANFELSPYFKYKGDVKLVASNPFLFFDGECRIKHQCNELKITWVKFASQVDPNNIAIPISGKPVSEDGVALAASPVLSPNPDSIYMYPAFLSPLVYPKKDVILQVDSGFLAYDKGSGQYRISNKEKLVEQSLPGNYISFDTRRCTMYNEGKMNFGTDYGALDAQTIGSMTDYIIPDSINAKVMLLLNFFFDDGALEKIGTEISNFANLKPFDYSKLDYQKNLREVMGKDAADKLISQLTLYGTMKKLPKELQTSLTFSQVSFKWNKSTNSYVSFGPLGLGSVGKVILNKIVDGKIEFRKKRGNNADELNIYFELDPMHWYYFKYSQGVMAAVSSNADFNNIIEGIKPDKRETKTDKGKFIYQLGQTQAKTIFLRRVAEGNGNDQ